MTKDQAGATHLTEGELFTLAVPPAGEPEALPRHLSGCLACSRALSEWKAAVRDLADQDIDALSRRAPQDWEGLEDRTLQAIARSRAVPKRSRWRWMAVAAALILFALALPLRKGSAPSASAARASAELSAQDQADDALLRDVARLSRGEEGSNGSWISLVPEPDGSSRDDGDRL